VLIAYADGFTFTWLFEFKEEMASHFGTAATVTERTHVSG
jgi:hypothetical protein